MQSDGVKAMRDFLTDFYGDERNIAIMIDKGLTRDEIFVKLQDATDATDLINAIKREIQKGDDDA